jgi:Tfp pilus assembly protein PilF
MRITAISAACALMLLTVSSALVAQKPDDQIDPKSVSLVQEGRTAQAAGNIDGATDAFEAALVVDPRNRAAYVALAEIARTRGLPGKAIRLYREALLLEPNDLTALRGQGEAMVQKGAVEKANQNLARIKTICGTRPCNDATVLAAAIAKGPPANVTANNLPHAPSPATPAPAAKP